jgi:peroxiredoxin
MNKNNLLICIFGLVAMVIGLFVYFWQQHDFQSIDGQSYRYKQLNEQVVIVNYFAEWCAPCIKEIPALNQLNDWVNTQPDMQFFAVSYDALSAAELKAVGEKYSMAFPLVADVGSGFPIAKPPYLPATFVLDKGHIKGPILGEQTYDSLKVAIADLLAAP